MKVGTRIFYSILSLGFFIGSLSAQTLPFKIGESVGDLALGDILNYSQQNVRTNDLKGKLIILDFGNLGCSSCIKGLKEMDSLSREFSGRAVIFWVTPDSVHRIRTFLKTNHIGKTLSLPIIANDTLLAMRFEHKYFPYEVWIDPCGIVSAFTDPHYVDEYHINQILSEKRVNWRKYNGIAHDYDQNLISLNKDAFEGNTTPSNCSYSFFSGYLEGLMAGYREKRDSSGSGIRYTFINMPIVRMYLRGIQYLDPAYRFVPAFCQLDIADSSNYFFRVGNGYQIDWNAAHTYCYESNLPSETSDKDLGEHILRDLNAHFHSSGNLVRVKRKCWLLVKAKGFKASQYLESVKKDGSSAKYVTAAEMNEWINTIQSLHPAIDSSGLDFHLYNTEVLPIDEGKLPSLRYLNSVLRSKGLKFVERSCYVEIFCLSEKVGQDL